MPDTTQQLVFKLIIDGKEAVATLDVVKGEFVVTGKAGEQANEQIKKAYQELVAEALKYNQVNEASVKGLTEYISSQNVSTNIIEATIKSLDHEITVLGVNSEAWKQKIAASLNLKTALGNLLLQQTALSTSDETVSKSHQLLTTEALKYNTVTESSVMLLSQYIGTQNLTAESIQNVIRQLEQEAGALGMNSEAWKLKMTAAANLRGAMQSMTQTTTGMNMGFQAGVPGVNSMRMAMTQFGYTLNDAQMFMVNARMGLMGISNNIPMIVQSFNDARNAATRLGTSLSTQLVAALAGGGGLIVGINAVMLLLNVLPGLFGKTTESIKEQAEAVEELAKKLKELEGEIPAFDFPTIEVSFEKQNEFNDAINNTIEKEKKLRDELTKRLELLKEPATRIVKGEPVVSGTVGSAEEIKKLTNELADYDEKIKQLNGDNEFFNNILDRTQGKLVGLDERIKTQIISSGEWGTIINRLTKNEIKALTGSLDKSNSSLEHGSTEYKTAKENLTKLHEEIGKLDSQYKTDTKEGERFAESKKKEIEKYYQIQFKKDEIDRLAAKDYMGLLEELEQAEKDYTDRVNAIKTIGSKKDLDTNEVAIDLLKVRIDAIKDAVKKLEDLSTEDMEAWRKNVDELLKYLEKLDSEKKKFEEDRQKFFAGIKEETTTSESAKLDTKESDSLKQLKAYEDDEIQKAILAGASADQLLEIEKKYQEMRTALQTYYGNERKGIVAAEMDQMVNIISDAYNNVFNLISSNVKDEISEWKNNESEKIDKERDAALSHAQTQKQREKINEQYDKKKEELDKEADKKARERLAAWFNLQKAISITQAIIATYRAANEQLSMMPVGPWNFALAAAIIAAGLANVAVIAAQKAPKGFAKGGILPEGKAGIFEGTHREIVAPEEDFKSVFHSYSADLVKRALVDYKNYVTINSGRGETEEVKRQLTRLESTVNKLNDILDSGIDARAVYDDDAAQTLYLKGRGKYRRGKI